MTEMEQLQNRDFDAGVWAVRPATKQWFAAYTTCRHEKRVASHLEHKEIEYYLPTYRSQRRWKDGSRVVLDLPLFPSYVFVHIRQEQRVPVLEVPGVLSIVGRSASRPTPLSDFEMEALRSALDPLHVEPCVALLTGQRVRIRRGALSGIEGIVVRQKSSFRVVITLELIMQSIAVEVNADDLEPLDCESEGLPSPRGFNFKRGGSVPVVSIMTTGRRLSAQETVLESQAPVEREQRSETSRFFPRQVSLSFQVPGA